MRKSQKIKYSGLFVLPVVLFMGQACGEFKVGAFLNPSSASLTSSDKACVSDPGISYTSEVEPILKSNCLACHSGASASGNFRMDFATEAEARAAVTQWKRISARVAAGTMPPSGALPQASAQKIATFFAGLQGASAAPGRVAFHRLNSYEYTNSVNDLFQINGNFAGTLPADEAGAYGFDNMADTMVLDTDRVEKFLQTAQAAVALAFETSKARIMICAPSGTVTQKQCAEQILSAFARKAYRRAVSPDEVTSLARFAIDPSAYGGGSFEEGVQMSLKAMLTSPQFLFRYVQTQSPMDAKAIDKLTGFEVATRLAYFLWSSLPDDALLAAAEKGELEDPALLKAQIKRMLADAKSKRFTKTFASRWFETKNIANRATPDRTRQPAFTDELRGDMATESELFFDSLVREDRPILDVLEADYSFMNKRLATHYGLTVPGATDTEFKKVSLTDPDRFGFLGQASFLSMNAGAVESSPTKRGHWVMARFLCDSPPPAPPNVTPLDQTVLTETNIREKMTSHRQNSQCITCHATMDPIGFSLDLFSGIGQKRTTYINGDLLNLQGTLPTGQTFNGPQELRKILKSSGAFERCATEHLMSYSLGRAVAASDQCSVKSVASTSVQPGAKFSDLVTAIVMSPQFQFSSGLPQSEGN